jgi:predicted nucleotidyltransferase
MKTVGLIVEYNPFHNGHLHHLRESLRVSGAEVSVAVMSGHFLQRGEPALVDKWQRTEMALAAGVDLVLELPLPFACNSAPHFAAGAVSSLAALGVVDALCFGSEAGKVEPLQRIADVLYERAEEIAALTVRRLRDGVGYPVARAEALSGLLPDLPVELLASPNNILGIEYLLALRRSGSRIEPYTVARLGAGYHDTGRFDRGGTDGGRAAAIASATGIRRLLAAGEPVDGLMPESCARILADALTAGRCHDEDRAFTALQAQLLQGEERLGGIYLVDDGLERRLFKAALDAANFADLVDRVAARHVTHTRIRRTLVNVLLQLQRDEMTEFVAAGPLYLRLLGHSDKGRELLARARKRKRLPLIADPARARATLNRFYRNDQRRRELALRMLHLDLRATRLYGLTRRRAVAGGRNRDYFEVVRRDG